MFCHQCEQTAKGIGCDIKGVCGKNEEVANLQDVLVFALQGLAEAALAARAKGVDTAGADAFVSEALFSTLTNVNFDPERFKPLVDKAVAMRDGLAAEAGAVLESPAGTFVPAADIAGLAAQGAEHGLRDMPAVDPNVLSLKHTTLFGLKGVAAYADHARILGRTDPEVEGFAYKALAALGRDDLGLEDWVGLAMECGKANYRAMELLDEANTSTYGHPVPTEVPLGWKKGKAVLVSGHDLKDLKMLLEQTEGTGVNVYTHGEMLPAHGYPELKRHAHFHGHYGTAWQNQQKEFKDFPGPILMTTNCIQKPRPEYEASIFTTGLVGWPGTAHIAGNGDKDFSAVVEKALEMPGFAEDRDKGSVMAGFARNAVMGVAGDVIEAVKAGKIRHFFLVGGCDGAKAGRNYYAEFVDKVPGDCVVLTLACGKFRFFDKKLGSIGGIPRLLDIGQCNDAYSAIRIALALSEAFDLPVNELPLSMILSWYEQKAVAILLTLLSLGIKDIRLGPSLPAFVSGGVLDYLVKEFDIKPMTTPDEDLSAILG